MGYYSTVRLLAKKKVTKKIFKAIKENGSPFNEIKVSPSGLTYYFEAYTKWDDYCRGSYPDVDAIMDVLDKADEADYYLIRVGQEDGDIDRYGEGYGTITEAEIYSDDKDECIDTWFNVNNDGTTVKSTPIERLTPFWEEFKEKAKMFGVEITKELPEIAK